MKRTVTFPCVDLRKSDHVLSAEKISPRRLEVTLDGDARKVNLSKFPSPNAVTLGRVNMFGSHEHCIFEARACVNAMLETVLAGSE